ncbi:hypothetical protein [Sphingobium tyrosinilyticum]|uniref:Transposase n=1 Tax=Sphingobium tyrosinilyticum TaxID=2715436 RepID=A0ABV9F689_9SPHN
MRQAGLFGLSDHLKRLSARGDPLEELGRIVDFEAFRPVLVAVREIKETKLPCHRRRLQVMVIVNQVNLSDAGVFRAVQPAVKPHLQILPVARPRT